MSIYICMLLASFVFATDFFFFDCLKYAKMKKESLGEIYHVNKSA